MRLILEEEQKYLQSFIHNATYHPMDSDAEVTYQAVNLFSSDKYFIYLFYLHYVLYLHTCRAMIFSHFGIAFLLYLGR